MPRLKIAMRFSYVVAVMAAPLLAQPQAVSLTLQQAEQMALQNNPQFAAAKYTADAAKQVPLEVRSAFFPTFSGAVTSVGAQSGSRLAAGGLNNPAVYNRFASGLMVNQLVTDFGRTKNLEESANLRAQAQDQTTETTRANILVATARAYFGVLGSRSVLKVAEQTVTARQLVSDQVGALARNNLKSNLDLNFANVNLADAKLLLLQAQNTVKAEEAQLAQLLGLPNQVDFDLKEEPAPGPLSENAEDWIDKAVQDRPELKDLRLQQMAAERLIRAEHALKYPTIAVAGSAGFAPYADSAVQSRFGAVGLNLSIPIFNGGLFSHRQTESELRAMAASENVSDLLNHVKRDVRVALLNAQTARERVGLTAQLLQQAQMALDLARGRYDLGLSSIVELSQSQLNLTSAQINSASAEYDYQAARAILDYQAGALH